ncbi:hypothetical protein [Spirosoma pollinicola]|uniref:Uncharacterized protein n=1 Tax=Spirosoma pollinicola TaxID=2057025 RepID=A0A2K8Z7Q9_9BACT|nr:hypothetical protein [Spirosoma pollinicola]AUD05905.1 hypothetical protein CWM47_31115 [Spirosoma pollinicola]
MHSGEIVDQIDLSALPAEKRPDFVHWITQRAYIRSTLTQALQRGRLLKGYNRADAPSEGTRYGLRIETRSPGNQPRSIDSIMGPYGMTPV